MKTIKWELKYKKYIFIVNIFAGLHPKTRREIVEGENDGSPI